MARLASHVNYSGRHRKPSVTRHSEARRVPRAEGSRLSAGSKENPAYVTQQITASASRFSIVAVFITRDFSQPALSEVKGFETTANRVVTNFYFPISTLVATRFSVMDSLPESIRTRI